MVFYINLITLELVNLKNFLVLRTRRHAMNMQGDRPPNRCGVLEDTYKPLFLTPTTNVDVPEVYPIQCIQ
jgi:hypothetical protein